MKCNKQELVSHFKSYKDTVLKNLPPSDYYEIIEGYIEKNNFLQILYGMGITYLLIILEFFEDKEDYVTCSIIRETIVNHNKISGDNLKTRI